MGNIRLSGGDFSGLPYLLYSRQEDFDKSAMGKTVFSYDRTIAPNHELFFIEGGIRHVFMASG